MHGMQPSQTEGPPSMPQLASHDIADEELFTLVLQVARHGWIQGPCSADCDQGEGQQDNADNPMHLCFGSNFDFYQRESLRSV